MVPPSHCSNFPMRCGGRAGEGAFFVAEQFAFQQVFRNGGAVDGEEGPAIALAVMIDGAGDEFLAGAAFAGDQGRGVAAGELADDFENVLHGLAAADDAQVVILRFQQRLVRDDLPHVARGLEGVENDLFEAGHVEGFEEVIVSAQFHRLDGGLGGAVGGHHDDHLLGVDLAKAAERFQAAHAAHADVHDDQVGLERGISFKPSSPLSAVVNSMSGWSKMRRNEYCTSASSSIKSNLSIMAFGDDNARDGILKHKRTRLEHGGAAGWEGWEAWEGWDDAADCGLRFLGKMQESGHYDYCSQTGIVEE